MKKFIIGCICFLIGFGAILTYRYIRAPKLLPPVEITTDTNNSPTPEPTRELQPPAQALSGMLTVLKGHTELFARNADGYAEASTGAQIRDGESVATKENSQASVAIANFITATLDESTELGFSNLFASDMVLQQKIGKVSYQLVEGVSPVAIRALHALISVRSGETAISITDTDISITVKTGSVKLALVDNDNTTHVWDVAEGQRATIDDRTRDVTLLKAR